MSLLSKVRNLTNTQYGENIKVLLAPVIQKEKQGGIPLDASLFN